LISVVFARSIAATILAIVFAVPAAAQTAPPVTPGSAGPGSRIVLPGGTTISIVVADKISSANANVGDTFAIRANEDVVVGGWVAIAKGAAGQGEILTVDRAGSHGHPGSLGVQMDWIYAVDGDKVKLTSQRKTEEGQGEGGKSSTITILSWAFLGLPGLFAHNFVKGHDITIDSTHPLAAYVDDSVYVVASTKSDASPGYAQSVAADGGMAPTALAAYATPVGAPSVSAAAAATTIYESEGTGSKTSKPFAVNASWAIAWSYDCSKAPKSAAAFAVTVQGGSPESAISPTGPSGIDITHFHDAGTFYLNIETGCTWHVRVFSEAS
jgi:hypothetical protein